MLSESQLRNHYGMTLLLIRRGSDLITNPSPSIKLMGEDILVVIGNKNSFQQANNLFGDSQSLLPVST